jgi:hypothetical protein
MSNNSPTKHNIYELIDFNMSKKDSNMLQELKPYTFSQYDLYIKKSGIVNSGFGIFTRDFIPKGSLIDKYLGKYIEGIYGGDYFFRIDDEIGIDASSPPRCYMAFLNDASYRPTSKRGLRNFNEHKFVNNCKFESDIIKKTVSVYSIMDIEPESELFISYGNDYW